MLFNITRLLRSSSPLDRRPAKNNARPLLEQLEDRTLLAAFVVNSAADTDDSICDTQNCTLREAINSANANAGGDTIEFNIPTTDPRFDGTAWTISLGSTLPTIIDSDTQILGFTQTTNQGDTNSGQVGTGGTVGVDQLPLPLYERPEIAIHGPGVGQSDDILIAGTNQITVNAITVEGIAFFGGNDAIRINNGTDHVLSGNFIGLLPTGLSPTTLRNTGYGVRTGGDSNVHMDANYVGHNGHGGLVGFPSSTVVQITRNEVFESGWNSSDDDGIDLNGINGLVEGNLSYSNSNAGSSFDISSGHGIELGSQDAGTGGNVVVNNTTLNNSSSGVGVRKGASGNTIEKNIITNNQVGISVHTEDRTTTQNTFTQNSIFDNIGLGIDLVESPQDPEAFDGVTLNDPGDVDGGANELNDFAILTEVKIVGDNIVIRGFSQPGDTIEFFVANHDPSGFGEGEIFLTSGVEGGASDTDISIGTYGPSIDVLGTQTQVSTSAVTTNMFEFTFPNSFGLTSGNIITTTATGLDGSTSEFGPNAELINCSTLSGFAYLDDDNDGVFATGETPIGGLLVTLSGVDVNGNTVQRTTITLNDGAYIFDDLPSGTYDVTMSQPNGLLDGTNTPGTLGGTVAEPDQLTDIVIGDGEFAFDNNFAYLEPGSISGFSYIDDDNDGIFDAGETPLPGQNVILTGIDDQGNAIRITTTTAVDGSYGFVNLRGGTYTVAILPAGGGLLDGVNTPGSSGGTASEDVEIVDILLGAGDDATENNFAHLEPASISGRISNDVNNDGTDNGGTDPGIENVLVTLTGRDDRGDAVTATALTDSTGNYTFDALRPGVYRIRETQPRQFAQGNESAGSLGGRVIRNRIDRVNLPSGTDATDYDFRELTRILSPDISYTRVISNGTNQRLKIRFNSSPELSPRQIRRSSLRINGIRPQSTRFSNRHNSLAMFIRANHLQGLQNGLQRLTITGTLRDGTYFTTSIRVRVTS